jgi:hypothetical protein
MGRGLDGFRYPLLDGCAVLRDRRVRPPPRASRPRAAPERGRSRHIAGPRDLPLRAATDFGGFGVRETPLPIPNREVKPHSADGT